MMLPIVLALGLLRAPTPTPTTANTVGRRAAVLGGGLSALAALAPPAFATREAQDKLIAIAQERRAAEAAYNAPSAKLRRGRENLSAARKLVEAQLWGDVRRMTNQDELGEFRALSKEAAEALGTERGQPGEEALKIRKAVLDSLYALDMFVYKREYNGIGEALKGDFGVDRVIVDIAAPLKDLDAAAAAYDKFLAAVSM